MIVTVFEDGDEAQLKLLQQSDLALRKTDKKTVDGQRLYKVTKSRHGPTGRYVAEDEIHDFVQDYEQKEQERKSAPETRQSQHRPKVARPQ